jgi:hypothetical protein
MKKLLSVLLLGIILIGGLSFGTQVQAQKVIEDSLRPECKSALNSKISLFSSLSGLINPGANLPFVPSACGTDKDGRTTAIPVAYFPFVLLNVYKFMISIGLYLFTLGIIILGVIIQFNVFSSNYNYQAEIRKRLKQGITGFLTILFAYFIVYLVLWVFNADKILSTPIVG